MERSYIQEIFNKGKEEKVLVKGWVHETRDLGKIRFLLLRDLTGIIQVTYMKAKADKNLYDLMASLRESVLSIEGKIVKSKQAPGGFEIIPEKIDLIAEAEHPLPVDVSDFSKTELPKRLDYRFLDLHRKRTQAVFKIQNTISNAFREFFYNQGFIEMQPPCVISAASEGGTELFPVQYFEKKAFLAQSPQLYKQMLACSIEKTFMITPVWRAEKHNTTRHINEIRQMDIEVAFCNQMDIMKYQDEVVKYMVKQIIEKNPEELTLLDVKLKIPTAKYITYEETIKLLKKNKIKIEEGDDLSAEAEKKLNELFPDTIVFVHSWPLSLKPFYIYPKNGEKDAKLSEGFDAIYKGIEISSGGQRIHLPNLLIERLKVKGLNPKNFQSYIDSFRYGAPYHAGWSIGLERFTQIICGFDNIKEATLFPRDRDRLTP
ncbi:aspartate--tRNA(Asn) ligase [Candidatus Woesearchaeota archaeon CG10_big_fil_rev_8_21_14_0_10_34_12]|nr:MAG: aspartate--tRNA(Asn) ligase [Candidatus Woesearchaeota archaeon CG10_big_fil_rev_8_21_14_0_10_34_12]